MEKEKYLKPTLEEIKINSKAILTASDFDDDDSGGPEEVDGDI